MSQKGIPCAVMRGGTSKGLVFARDVLPADTDTRDAVLLAAMGSPDPREIDGLGGAHPLTSKVAVVSPSCTMFFSRKASGSMPSVRASSSICDSTAQFACGAVGARTEPDGWWFVYARCA